MSNIWRTKLIKIYKKKLKKSDRNNKIQLFNLGIIIRKPNNNTEHLSGLKKMGIFKGKLKIIKKLQNINNRK